MAKRRNKSSEEGAGAGFAILVLLWLIIKFIWWIVGALVLIALFYLVRAIVRETARRRAENRKYCAAIAARAEQQHNWVMQGDDRGIYGTEGAKLMRIIRSGGPASPPRPV